MAHPVFHVDAFTDVPFRGNPAAVCLLEERADSQWSQSVASELSLAATAFVVLDASPPFGLRWFSPSVELTLCGHGSIAAAHVLFEQGAATDGVVAFDSTAGRIEAKRTEDGWVALDFPAVGPSPAGTPPRLAEGLGVEPRRVSRNDLDYLVELGREEDVVAMRPDLGILRTIEARGFIITAASGRDDCDFVSRYFGPAVGVPEDAVTGSAHAALGPYWAPKLGKRQLTGYQASSRGGFVRVTILPSPDRIEIAGQAVTVFAGRLL